MKNLKRCVRAHLLILFRNVSERFSCTEKEIIIYFAMYDRLYVHKVRNDLALADFRFVGQFAKPQI